MQQCFYRQEARHPWRRSFRGKSINAPKPAAVSFIVFFFLFPQGTGGSFTHFYPGTHHAVDLECPEGTPVLAMASGFVKKVRQSNPAGGIHARGLFDWNSVSLILSELLALL